MPKAKQARPPPDDPAQSERFMKDAAELAGDDAGKLFERAMQSIARPAPDAPIIEPRKAGKKKPAKATKKSGSAG
jgi:hypothetical protein